MFELPLKKSPSGPRNQETMLTREENATTLNLHQIPIERLE